MRFSPFFLLFTLCCMLLFALYPEIDIQVASLFYDAQKGFYLKEFPLFHFLYKGIGPIMIGTFLALFLGLYWQKKRGKEAHFLHKKAVGFLLLFFLIGPGIITNLIFKEHSGRARPVQIIQFGGEKQFTPYYEITNQCEHNCSFISGHAAAAFFFMAFGYVMHSRLLFWLGFSFGVLMALTRMAQGGHFLSDVTFAFIINLIVLKILYYLYYKEGAVLEK